MFPALFERPALILSPPQPFKTEDRKVLIGAREPMTLEHMVLEMHLEDAYTTVRHHNTTPPCLD